LFNRGIMDWKDKLEKIRAKIAEKDKILVAFSGD
jgi:PP-loop superfamily ATP-utilizing enzyme